MSRQSPLWPSSDPSSCDWDEYGRRKSTFEPSNPAMPEMATDITSLLSAQSYLLPEPSWAQNSQSSTPSPGDSGFVLELESANYRNPPNQPDPSKLKTPRVQRRQQRGRQKVASVKGQEGDDHHENPTERRRIQTRMAQRAYRSRQQALTDGLKSRISELESSLDKMSSAMLSFSEQLVQSGVLRSQPALTANMRDAMKIFLTTASDASLGDESSFPVNSTQTDDKILASQPLPATIHSSAHIGLRQSLGLPLNGTQSHQYDTIVLPQTVNPLGTSLIEVSKFTQRLHEAALYQGYIALSTPSISLGQLQWSFGFNLSMMSRERLTSFFKAELYAQVSKRPLNGWEEVPFFRLGGAGTHYPLESNESFLRPYQKWGTVEDPLPLVTADLRAQLQGDWFDLYDLEGYIREKNVLLVVSAGEPVKFSEVQITVHAQRFMTTLISRGVCLGRTPGFQREDVERALLLSAVK
ncbi:hypothetical protein POX_f08374 [Penicillium oxalicum]|uniref:hypothetical protein n=1 Tax=Penicillium oxalicum TaxID=69781 RepID=UPI0020B6D3B7|nr:hypothetical protein POX_f08374 [Penicillium oxalicum]KAI2787991.1 hypothetical protein POX_f08374 [Penicillium oxalicum]